MRRRASRPSSGRSRLQFRSNATDSRLSSEVTKVWGPVLTQEHPALFYEAPTSAGARRAIQPEKSDIAVKLTYDPKQKGLLWYRTYKVAFTGGYLVKNPTQIPQTIYVEFKFPAANAPPSPSSTNASAWKSNAATQHSPLNSQLSTLNIFQ